MSQTTLQPDPPVAAQPTRPLSAEQRFRFAVWGPVFGFAVNVLLVAVKVAAGLVSGSVALLADAGHSGADVLNNLLVIGALFYSRRPADESHPYGHDRAEVLVAATSAHLLTAAGLFLGWESIQKLISGTPTPSFLAFWVAVATLLIKLVVVRVELRIARSVASQAVEADARDSQADVFSSLAVVFGVLGARLGAPRLDGIGGLVIAGIVVWTAINIGIGAGRELMESNIDRRLSERVRSEAGSVPGVCSVTAVTGRAHGSDMLVEIGIEVDPKATVEEGARIAEAVRHNVIELNPEVASILVELNADHVERLRKKLT
jgi:cation diffusion facilitator family transporter